jgi:A/G-specific adenine glycosylase
MEEQAVSPRVSELPEVLWPEEERGRFGAALIDWFQASHRDLPWRRTNDPYAIWVSEIMLQQTQVRTVIPYYERFLQRFPTLAALATADEEAVIHAWAGLGYYARARNLWRGVQAVMERYGGTVPRDPAELLRLPGVGRYTAGAIASIAFNVPAPILDGNVIRVLCRLFALRGDPKSRARGPTVGLSARLWELAEALIPEGQAAQFNPAMMELGATVCTPVRPACDRCPVAPWCRARGLGAQEELPETAKVGPPEAVRMVAGVVWSSEAFAPSHPLPAVGFAPAGNDPVALSGPKVLLCRGLATLPARPIGIAAMWQFPNGPQRPGESARAALERVLREVAGIDAEVGEAAGTVKHSVTRYRVTLSGYHCHRFAGAPAPAGCDAWTWVDPAELEELALPAAHRRLAQAVTAGVRRSPRALGPVAGAGGGAPAHSPSGVSEDGNLLLALTDV